MAIYDAASDEKGRVMYETLMAIRGTKQNGNKTTLREKADRVIGSFIIMMHFDN